MSSSTEVLQSRSAAELEKNSQHEEPGNLWLFQQLSKWILIKTFQSFLSCFLLHRAPWGKDSPGVYRGHAAL